MSRYELQALGEAKSNDEVATILEDIAAEIRNGEHGGSDEVVDWTLSVHGDDLD